MSRAKLTLVGAGPGDPELFTVKGIKALADADIVLYDALVHPDLLQYAGPGAKKVFVGKRAGHHHHTQDEINQLIVDYALSGCHVVRLKGGDPFIFGRGKEELEYAETFNIETATVLGISSINLPGYYGVPLTRRGINESFWVITATTSQGTLSGDVTLAAQSNATVVLLMGLNKLPEITTLFQGYQRGSLPVAVISRGSLEDGKMVLGTVDSILEKTRREEIAAPAIIVLGEAVGTHEHFYEKAIKAAGGLL